MTAVMPNFNHAHLLVRAVSAFADQTVPVDIIIVDDASTDNSLEVIAALQAIHPQIRLVRRTARAIVTQWPRPLTVTDEDAP
jgi:glycosyltransferase involved in cell wall biosynthesis